MKYVNEVALSYKKLKIERLTRLSVTFCDLSYSVMIHKATERIMETQNDRSEKYRQLRLYFGLGFAIF